MLKKTAPRGVTRKRKVPLFQIFIAACLTVLFGGGLIAALLLNRTDQNIESDASVSNGIVQVYFSNTKSQVKPKETVLLPLVIKTNNMLIDGAQLGIRVKGVKVENVNFSVVENAQFKLSQNRPFNDNLETGMDLVFLSTSNKPILLQDNTQLGILKLTPTTAGTLDISFDTTLSKVTTSSLVTTDPDAPVQQPAWPDAPRQQPAPQPISTEPSTSNEGENTVPGSMVAPAPQVRDVLQTPLGITIEVVPLLATVQPTSSPVPPPPGGNIRCQTQSDCPAGMQCYQPPMTPCPEGAACADVMPNKYCRILPTPSPILPARCSLNAECPANSRCVNGICERVVLPTPSPYPTPVPSPRVSPEIIGTNPINWITKTASLKADNFYIEANGKRFTARNGQVRVSSDQGSNRYKTLEMMWNEHETEMRLFIYFASDGQKWRATEIRTYNGQNPGNWLYYNGTSYSAVGSSYFAGDFAYQAKNGQGTLYMKNMNLMANFQSAPVSSPVGDPLNPADLNKDGKVNVLDLSLLVKNLLQRTRVGDLNNDGIVDLSDYSTMLNYLQ